MVALGCGVQAVKLLAGAWGTSTLVPLELHAPCMALVGLPAGLVAAEGQGATSADAKYIQVKCWIWGPGRASLVLLSHKCLAARLRGACECGLLTDELCEVRNTCCLGS